MNIIYYSTAFHSSHGGSLQSIEFVKAASTISKIEKLIVFPEQKVIQNKSKSLMSSPIRKILRSIPLLQILFLYRRNKFYQERLFETIRKIKPDAIIIQLDSTFIQALRIKKAFPDLKVISVVNSSPFDEPFKNIAFRNYFKRLEAKLLFQLDGNVFVSDYLRQRIMGKRLNEKRDIVVHNGVDISKFKTLDDKGEVRLKYGFPKKSTIIGYVGTLDKHKKVDVLIEAFSILFKKDTSYHLVIVGDGAALRALKEKVEKLRCEKGVTFTGWVQHNEVVNYLNSFDVAVHHYANEYMSPLKIFEYLAVGLKVIGPDIAAVREVFQHKIHLYLTNGKKEDIVQKIESIASCNDIANNGQALMREKYTWLNHTEKIINQIV